MKKKSSSVLAVFFLLAIVGLGLYLILNQRGSNIGTDQVRIAVNIPLTGPVAQFSGQYANGLTKGIDDTCKELGVDRNLISLDIQDNQGSASTAATIAQKHLIKGFDVYISGVLESKAVAELVEPECEAHFIVNYLPEFVREGKNRLRVLPHFALEGKVYARYSLQRGAKNVAGICLNNPDTKAEFLKYVEPVLKENNVAFALETFEFATADFKTIAAKVKQANPDVILISGFAHHIPMILDALRSQSLIENGNVLCIMNLALLLSDEESNKKFSGVAFVATPFNFPENKDPQLRWVASYERQFGPEPTFVTAHAYDTGRLLVSALSKHNKLTRKSIIETTPIQGVCGKVQLDTTGDFSTPMGVILVESDGSLRKLDLESPVGSAK